jgi:hypothetical protein
MSLAEDAIEPIKPTSGGGRPTVYKTKDGKRVPGVTTILSRFKESGGLIHWAWSLGIEGKDYRQARDDAAGTGHIVHQWIDDYVHNRVMTFPPEGTTLEQLAQANKGMDSFRSWAEQVKLTFVDTERALVSEEHRFGGTYDSIAYANGVLMQVDWKSGNRIYGEHICQLAAYRQLMRETTPVFDPKTGKASVTPNGACLLRVGKEMGDFHYHYFPSEVLAIGWEAFRRMRELYDLDAQIKRVIG